MVVAGVVGFGIARGGLVHDSLTFRWRYWIGAMRMVRDHLWRGVGFANFGDYYLAVRLPIASEEIRDPHNFFVRILSETGLIGAGLLIAWLMRLAWEITLPVRSTIQEVRSDKRTSLMPLFALAVAAMVLNVIVSVDLTQSAAFSLLEILKRILWAGLLSVGLAIGCMESSQRQQFDDRPAPWIVLAMLASLAMFMLHNTIEFGWFESGPTGMFALITGSLMGISSAGRERRATWPVFAAAVASWSAAAAFWVEPICRGESLATSGDDRVMANHLDDAVEAYRDATAALPVTDAQLLLKTATAQLYARADPAEVVPTMEASLSADPMFIRSHLARAELELRLVKPDAAVVRREYDQAIALDPADVGMRTDYANTLQSLGDYHGAALELEAALSANAGLSPDEPKRLSRQQVDEISQRISQLRAQLPAMP
jgi:hypothetical protein